MIIDTESSPAYNLLSYWKTTVTAYVTKYRQLGQKKIAMF